MLHVKHSDEDVYMKLETNQNNAFLQTQSNSHKYGLGTAQDHFGIYDYNSEAYRFKINNNGNVAIGKNTATEALDVVGSIKSSNALLSLSLTTTNDANIGGNAIITGTITSASNSTIGNLTLADGSITDSSSNISFGDNNLTTTGEITATTFNGKLNGSIIINDDAVINSTNAEYWLNFSNINNDYSNIYSNNNLRFNPSTGSLSAIKFIGEIEGDLSGNVTIPNGKELNIIDGEILLRDDQISGDKINGGTIGSITIAQLAGSMDCANKSMTNVNIDSGVIDNTNITVGTGKTLDVSLGSLTTSETQNLDIIQGANSNIDIGNFDFRAKTLTADGLTAGSVVIAGTDGLLTEDSDITFSGSTLTVTDISSSGTIGGNNINGTNINGTTITDGTAILTAGDLTEIKSITGSASSFGTLDNIKIGETTRRTGKFTNGYFEPDITINVSGGSRPQLKFQPGTLNTNSNYFILEAPDASGDLESQLYKKLIILIICLEMLELELWNQKHYYMLMEISHY